MSRSVTDIAWELRIVAEAEGIGKSKQWRELYDLLQGCAVLADRCAAGADNAEMRRLVAQQPTNGNRRYVERGSDEFLLVCRFVFTNQQSSGANRSNASRYAHCLREAKSRGIAACKLAKHLEANGGVNALFLSRPNAERSVQTKTLHLTSAIKVPKFAPITLTVNRRQDGKFDVMSIGGAP